MPLSWNTQLLKVILNIKCSISLVWLYGVSSWCLFFLYDILSTKNNIAHLNCIMIQDPCRNLELLKLNLLDTILSMCLIRHLACASQLLLFYPRTRASLTRLIQMELALHGYQRKIFPTTQKSLQRQVLLEDLITTDAWTCMSFMVHSHNFDFQFTF